MRPTPAKIVAALLCLACPRAFAQGLIPPGGSPPQAITSPAAPDGDAISAETIRLNTSFAAQVAERDGVQARKQAEYERERADYQARLADVQQQQAASAAALAQWHRELAEADARKLAYDAQWGKAASGHPAAQAGPAAGAPPADHGWSRPTEHRAKPRCTVVTGSMIAGC